MVNQPNQLEQNVVSKEKEINIKEIKNRKINLKRNIKLKLKQ